MSLVPRDSHLHGWKKKMERRKERWGMERPGKGTSEKKKKKVGKEQYKKSQEREDEIETKEECGGRRPACIEAGRDVGDKARPRPTGNAYLVERKVVTGVNSHNLRGRGSHILL